MCSCPYSAGLQQLLKVCSQYCKDYDIIFNAKKDNIMIVSCDLFFTLFLS